MADSTNSGQQIFQELSELASSVMSGVKVEENVLERYSKDFGGKPGFQRPIGARMNGKDVEVLGANGDVLATFQVTGDGQGKWIHSGEDKDEKAAAAPEHASPATAS